MMKKITINHYLNKRLQPTIIYENIVAYPLYLQIIVQRKTQQIKSFFNAYMSEKAFEIMQNGGSKNDYMYETSYTTIFDFDLENEPKIISEAINYLISNDIEYNLKSKCFKTYIETYLQRAVIIYGNEAAKIEVGRIETDDFINCLNLSDKTLIHDKKVIEKTLHKNIFNYIPAEYIKLWQVVELVKNAAGIKPFISFIANNPESQLIKVSKLKKVRDFCQINKETQITEIEIIDNFNKLNKRINQSIKNLFH